MEPDLLKLLAATWLEPARQLAAAAAVPASVRGALLILIETSGLAAIAGGFAAVAWLLARPAVRDSRGGSALRLGTGWIGGGVALGLTLWLMTHPSPRFDDLFARWDHLACVACWGLALAALGGTGRKWVLVGLSVVLIERYAGAGAVLVAWGATGIGLALTSWTRDHSRRTKVIGHALVVGSAFAVAFVWRAHDLAGAAQMEGLLVFWCLRHVNLMVVATSTGRPSLVDCATYLTFYPGGMGLLGGPELYPEFARRNLTRSAPLDHVHAAWRVLEGIGLVLAAALIPVSLADLETSTNLASAWGFAVVLFVRTALGVTGAWCGVDAAALFLGIRLRANFAGLLTARNPSELWWAWRGSLTNWLVQHVYAPLGAGNEHQTRNILATFAASFVWHAMSVPFLSSTFRPAQVAGVALWAAVNGVAVLAHLQLSRTGGASFAAPLPSWFRNGAKLLGVWALGSLTPILLSYQGPTVNRLPAVLRVLLGLA